MNMWGLTPKFMKTLEDGFKEFFANMGNKDILKAEYFIANLHRRTSSGWESFCKGLRYK